MSEPGRPVRRFEDGQAVVVATRRSSLRGSRGWVVESVTRRYRGGQTTAYYWLRFPTNHPDPLAATGRLLAFDEDELVAA